jgi:hypothetical protein
METPPLKTKKALLIGCNYLGTDRQLNGCINDIINIKTIIIENYGFTQENIILLRDDIPLKDTYPTRENIMKHLSDLVINSANCEEIWFQYSGHGDLVQEDISNLDNVIVPVDHVDKGVITDDELYLVMQHIKCRAIILIDCCHSGNIIELPWSFYFQNKNVTSLVQNNKYTFDYPAIYMYSSSRDEQNSLDIYSPDLAKYGGAFTNAFIICLKTRNYTVEFLDLYRDICIWLEDHRYTQDPVFLSSSSTIQDGLRKI